MCNSGIIICQYGRNGKISTSVVPEAVVDGGDVIVLCSASQQFVLRAYRQRRLNQWINICHSASRSPSASSWE